MSRILRPLAAALLALCASSFFASRSIAPPTLDREAVQRHQDDKHMAMVMWFAPQFFEMSAAGKADPAQVRRMMAQLEGYAIFGILDVKLDTTSATVVPGDRDRMRASARLKLGDQAALIPVPDGDLPDDVRAMVRFMKPMIAGMLGQVGSAMEFVVFKDADEHGKSQMNVRAHTRAALDFDNDSFTWNLPSVSLLPTRVDPTTGDTFPGDFDYSPFTGHKLETSK